MVLGQIRGGGKGERPTTPGYGAPRDAGASPTPPGRLNSPRGWAISAIHRPGRRGVKLGKRSVSFLGLAKRYNALRIDQRIAALVLACILPAWLFIGYLTLASYQDGRRVLEQSLLAATQPRSRPGRVRSSRATSFCRSDGSAVFA